jgi:hypothetical protein
VVLSNAMRSVVSGSVLVMGLGYATSAAAQGAGQYGQPQAGQGQSQYGSTPPATQPGIESGGLAPPPSNSAATPAQVQTEARLDESEKKDSGRGLEWIWLNAEVGFEHLGLQTFSAGGLVNPAIVQTTQTGPLYGAGLGVRLVFITLGAKFRIGTFSAYDLWTLNAEAGLRIPLGKLEPYLTLGGGFASLGSFGASNIGGGVTSANVSITGYDIRGGGGLDYYITPVFSVGAAVTFEVLGLTRPGVNLQSLQATGNSQGAAGEVYAADGSSLGSAFTGTLVLGLHF